LTLNARAAEHRPRKALVLLANEPRAYRESIAQVFRLLRPNVEVMTAEPNDLVRERVPVWVELYPEYGTRSVVGMGEERSTIEEIQLSDLLSVVDRAERLTNYG
jgi:hypothetical protein